MKIKLFGKTLKGKNRIRELGNEWSIIRTSLTVLFNPAVGPWALVQPVNGHTLQSRWIHLTHDVDFGVEK